MPVDRRGGGGNPHLLAIQGSLGHSRRKPKQSTQRGAVTLMWNTGSRGFLWRAASGGQGSVYSTAAVTCRGSHDTGREATNEKLVGSTFHLQNLFETDVSPPPPPNINPPVLDLGGNFKTLRGYIWAGKIKLPRPKMICSILPKFHHF